MSSSINHAARAHALLSPSGAHRWLHCTPSARLETLYPDSTSAAASEGTLAHEVCEAVLEGKPIPPTATDEMQRYAAEYATYIKGLRIEGDGMVSVEMRVNLNNYLPDGFGTVDCVVVDGTTLHIVDYKYGRGVKVDATDNPQLKLYALGVYDMLGALYDIDTVTLHIYQPRIGNISSFALSVSDLLSWGEEVKVKARIAYAGGDAFHAGDWCRFCRAAGECRARATELARRLGAGVQPDTLTPEELASWMDIIPDAKALIKAIEDNALRVAQSTPGAIKGYKVVAGRSVRKWANEDEVIKALRMSGYKDDEIGEYKLGGVPAIEKLLKKNADRPCDISSYIDKPEGKPTLVKSDDARSEDMGLAGLLGLELSK